MTKTKPLTTPSMRDWTAVVGDAPELQWKDERGYFPHVKMPYNRNPDDHAKLIINTGGWPMDLHDDHARLIAAAPDMVRELAQAWLAITEANKVVFRAEDQSAMHAGLAMRATRILQTIATARGMSSTDEAAAAIRAAARQGLLK